MSDDVFRAPMRARDRPDLVPGAGAEAALAADVVGIGPMDDRRVDRFAELPEGSLVWTRTTDGAYWLGRVRGPTGPAPAELVRTSGLRHVRATAWADRPVPPDHVPAAVARSFARGGLNLQRIRDPSARSGSSDAWRAIAG